MRANVPPVFGLQTTSRVPVLGSGKTVALSTRETEERSNILLPAEPPIRMSWQRKSAAILRSGRRQSPFEIAPSPVTRGDDGDLSLGSGALGFAPRDYSRMSTETNWSTGPWTIHGERRLRER